MSTFAVGRLQLCKHSPFLHPTPVMVNFLLDNQHLLGHELSSCSNRLLKVFAGFNFSVEVFQVEM